MCYYYDRTHSEEVGMRQLIAGIAVGVVFGSLAAAQDRDPFSGTWTLNVAKSKMVSPATASKSETVVYAHAGGVETFTADAVTSKDEAEHTTYTAPYDGANGTITVTVDGKVTNQGPMQLRQLDARTRLRIGVRKEGPIGGFIVRRLSEDGKTITSSILSFDADGSVVNRETRVFEKKP